MVLLLMKLTNSERLMKNAPARAPDQVRTTSTPPTWRAKDVGRDGCPPASTYGDGAPLFVRRGRRVHGEQIVASTRAVYPGSGRGGRVKPYSCFGLYCFGELGSFKS